MAKPMKHFAAIPDRGVSCVVMSADRTLLVTLAAALFATTAAASSETAATYDAATSANQVVVTVRPSRPWIERRAGAQALDFDLVVTNDDSSPLRLCEVLLRVYDSANRLVLERTVNSNGLSPGIDVVGTPLLTSGATEDLFNPFDRFDAEVPLVRLEYTLRYRREASTADQERNRHRLPLDFDLEAHASVSPRSDQPNTELLLPLAGRMLVWDGHDLWSHHRRIPLDDPRVLQMGIRSNANRYAADLIVVDSEGNLWRGDPWDKRHWLSYGADVFAPASGTVIATANDIPDNEFSGKRIVYPTLPAGADDSLGNFVITDHGHGEYSVLPHLQAGSVTVKRGDVVRVGQRIGRVGFSGDAIFPHVHYSLMDAPDVRRAEGLPAYFRNFRRWIGSRPQRIKRGVLGSGDVIERLGR
ncbi:MAG: family metallopeptidase [Myxococcales bacterium]|nr:family metallopeptidase [Myxococcales bacterium]